MIIVAMIVRPDVMLISELLFNYSDLPEFVELENIGVNTRGNFGNTPLHVAAARASSTEVCLLLNAGADINATGEHGHTPLHDAVAQGALDVVLLLLEHGASVSARNEFGETPSDLARALAHQRIVDALQVQA
ncbi:MAG: ankyrin repeat domain-containing protein [Rhodanobacteraceae bacterium]|nr:ankyrin repeat domain-containing protein [Rhodanobacteraceae bacterium]